MDNSLYHQDWSAGSSSWNATGFWERNDPGDPADPLYPEAWYAEGVTLNGNGHLDTGFGYNYAFSGWRAGRRSGVPGVGFTGGPIIIPADGYIEFKATPNATSLTKDSGLLNLGSQFLTFWYPAGQNPFGLGNGPKLYIEAWDFTFSTSISTVVDFAPVAGTDYTFRIEFKTGASGYLRINVKAGSGSYTTLYENLAFPFSLNGPTTDELFSYDFGVDLFGEYWYVDFGTVTTVAPLVNNSVPCCHDDGGTGSGGAGDTPTVDGTAPLPEWTARCTGGGDYPSGTPVTHAESWIVP